MWPAQSSGGVLFCCVNISVPGLPLKQIQEVSVALGLHPRVRHEAEGGAVDAVAHTVGRLRIAGEHMPQMGVTSAAAHLCAAHAVAQVLPFHHSRAFDGLCEGRPSRLLTAMSLVSSYSCSFLLDLCRRSSAAFLPQGLFIFTVSTAAAEEGGAGGTDTLHSITIIK